MKIIDISFFQMSFRFVVVLVELVMSTLIIKKVRLNKEIAASLMLWSEESMRVEMKTQR